MAAQLREVEATGTEIVPAFASTNGIVRFDEDAFEAWLRSKRDKAPADLDMSRAKDRSALSSYVDKLRTERANFKRDKLALTEGWREQTKLVNDAWNKGDALIAATIDEIAAPVVAWKEAEKARVAECEAVIQTIRDAATVTIEDTFASVQARGSSVHQTAIDLDRFGPLAEQALDAKKATIGILMEAMKRLKKEEADRAELEQLRAAQAERDAREAAEREARERIEAKQKYARQIMAYITDEVGNGTIGGKAYPYPILIRELEEKIETGEHHFGDLAQDVERVRFMTLQALNAAFDKSQTEAREKAVEEAARAARDDEARKAKVEQDRKDAEAQAKIDEANRRAAAAEQEADAEKARIAAKEEVDRKEAARVAEEQRKREADQQHRANVKSAAKVALMTCGADEETARKIVVAIIAGEIPAVRLEF